MLAEQSLKDGHISEALNQLQDQVRKDPSKSKYRVFLFQLLAVLGQWDRALTQLNVAGDMDASTLAMAQMYREALRCEVLRAEVFAGNRTPLIFGDPEQWLALLMEALRCTSRGEHTKAQELRDEAFEAAPTTSGHIDDNPFEWICDADARLGPVLEAIINGRYYWVPFHRIQTIQIEEPEDLRDCVWMPVHFTFSNGGESVGLIPTRYPGSENSEDDAIKLARKTEWNEPQDGVYLGMGQRLFATDQAEYALMDIRQINLNVDNQGGDSDTLDSGSANG